MFWSSEVSQLEKSLVSTLNTGNIEKILVFVKTNYQELYDAGLFEKFSKSQYDPSDKKWERTFDKYASKALQAKEKKDSKTELMHLYKAIDNGIGLPYYYERIAILHSKEKDYESAFAICQKYFTDEMWRCFGSVEDSLKMLKRMKKLESKLS